MSSYSVSGVVNFLLSHRNSFLFTGGFVRDAVLKSSRPLVYLSPCVYSISGHTPEHFIAHVADIDLATTLLPQQVAAILDERFPECKRIRRFATNSIQVDGITIEITSTRIDTECNGRNAKMKFGVSYFRDSFRRDFTFNALYMNSEGLIFDFHGGIKHLLAGEIHFIGDAKTRITEDYTRIKRYYNFAERLNVRNPDIEALIDYITKNSKEPIIMR